MSSATAGSLTDQILAEIENGLAHQRHKWAAQCQAHGLSMTHFHVLAVLEADGPTPMSRLADQLGVAFSNLTGIVSRMEERGIVERYTARLAELLAEETGAEPGDIVPISMAGALMTTHRALVSYVRGRVLAGVRGERLAEEYRTQARRAFARLERGLGDYAVKR